MYHPQTDQSTEPTNRLEGAHAPDTSQERAMTKTLPELLREHAEKLRDRVDTSRNHPDGPTEDEHTLLDYAQRLEDTAAFGESLEDC